MLATRVICRTRADEFDENRSANLIWSLSLLVHLHTHTRVRANTIVRFSGLTTPFAHVRLRLRLRLRNLRRWKGNIVLFHAHLLLRCFGSTLTLTWASQAKQGALVLERAETRRDETSFAFVQINLNLLFVEWHRFQFLSKHLMLVGERRQRNSISRIIE